MQYELETEAKPNKSNNYVYRHTEKITKRKESQKTGRFVARCKDKQRFYGVLEVNCVI